MVDFRNTANVITIAIPGPQGPPGPSGDAEAFDHGLLAGLTDDDHPQYHNNARGDARYAALSHFHTASNIIDATTVGEALMTATDAAAARAAINAGTSSIILGATAGTAAEGNHTHTKTDIGLGSVDNTSDEAKPISTATQTALNLKADHAITISAGTGLTGGGDLTVNRTLAVSYGSTAGTAVQGNDARVTADQAAGTASIRTIGTGALQAAAGNHTHTATGISDSTTVGRSVLTAANASAARAAIGAGTSDLALGSTSITAAAGNHTHVATAITDSTTVGRSVLTAADESAARTAIAAADLYLTTTNKTASSYTFILADANTMVESSATAAATYTVPPSASVAWVVGTTILIRQYTAFAVTLQAGAGVTLRSRGGLLTTAGQYSEAVLTYRGSNEWIVSGDLT